MEMKEFFNAYKKEVMKLIGIITAAEEIARDINGDTPAYCGFRAAERAALRRADRKSSLVELLVKEYKACQIIGWLNSRCREETGGFLLDRMYGYGDAKIGSSKNPEGEAMIRDFWGKAGYGQDELSLEIK